VSVMKRERRLLIIDDSDVFRHGLENILAGEGFSVETTPDGIVAQHMLNGNKYDIVLIDLMMPVMSGIDLYQCIEEGYPEVAARVVFMSTEVPDPATGNFFKKKARPFLLKPFTIDELLNATGN
jgi:DNA-binding response OmpR family regulator